MDSAQKLQITGDSGTGRVFFVVCDESYAAGLARDIFNLLCARVRVVLVKCPPVNDGNWRGLTEEFRSLISSLGLRQISLISLGDSGTVAQNLCLESPKLVRTAVFIDAATRPHRSLVDKIIDRAERALPMGLPFRSRGRGFDSSAFLQRLRCPTLVVTSPAAGAYLREQARFLARNLPTAWSIDIEDADRLQEFSDSILSFEEIPARRPQRSRAA